MAANAQVSKECPVGHIYLVPGRLKVRKDGKFFTPKTEEIIVDIMPTGAVSVKFLKPTAKLRLTSPPGCVFELPNVDQPTHYQYSYPVAGDKTQVQAVVINPNLPNEPKTINRTNSLSYYFPITGRAGRDITVEIVVTGEPTQVVADSCRWTVASLGLDTTNLGGKPFDVIVP
ncbi:hypothetical protein ACFVAV_33395 [Nocardia sp. NPDC057663]|uniref:hypothetical protein n=1 Tax=Nocardia sp. NPDC057663 TaxID=3346201 RepID=UPI00366C6198